MKQYAIFFLAAWILGLGIVLRSRQRELWQLYLVPHETLTQAVDLFAKENKMHGTALDLGPGSDGTEVAYLLKKNWEVWIIEKFKLMIEMMLDNPGIRPFIKNLHVIHNSFEKVDWNTLPNFDLIHASYSLPFGEHETFLRLWCAINKKLKIGGRFAGNIAERNPPYDSAESRSFFTKKQTRDLFQNFSIERYRETEKELGGEEEYNKAIRPFYWHALEVIAKKQSSSPVLCRKI